MTIEDLKIFAPLYYEGLNKKRIGSNLDGGYIISYMPNDNNYDIILSGGAGNNITFEKELSLLLQKKCLLYDHTVKIPRKKHITHFCEKLDKNNFGFFNSVNKHKNIFLKLDIEGGEYEILRTLTEDQIVKFKQIVIEIHDPHLEDRLKLIKKQLFTFHKLIHIHANNCCGTIDIKGVDIPKVMELTLVRNDTIPTNVILKSNKWYLPTNIDFPNVKSKPDIILNYYPFVSND
jgi:hypothetical protein